MVREAGTVNEDVVGDAELDAIREEGEGKKLLGTLLSSQSRARWWRPQLSFLRIMAAISSSRLLLGAEDAQLPMEAEWHRFAMGVAKVGRRATTKGGDWCLLLSRS